MNYDLLIRNGTVVREDRVERADIAVLDEKIAAIAPDIPGDARETIDATGLHVFPGVIDPHVHFNEPGRTEWEGFATGSAALAAGGGTLFFDMPLNSSPPVLDGESFDLKLEAAKRSSLTDFALWGGLTPKNLDRMEELAERGVVGFKAFMCDSGIEDFPRVNHWTLYEGMRKAAKLGLPVAVHAEDQALIDGRTRWARTLPHHLAGSWMASRLPLAEITAVTVALIIAQGLKCSLHVVHVSTIYGAESVNTFRTGGVNVSCETCPHYLWFEVTQVEQIGTRAKCAPPIRIEPNRDMLWDAVAAGKFDFIASDHSPSPPSMKASGDFFEDWGGVAGLQSTLPIMLSLEPHLDFDRVALMTATNAAGRFSIPSKGAIHATFDADFALVDVGRTFVLHREDLLDRHKLSPYVGRTFRGVIRRTILRGRTIFLDGKVVGPPAGRFVRPAR